MKIIYNDVIPFKGFIGVNLFGVLFVRNDKGGSLTDSVITHEEIHTLQMKELGYIWFYIYYLAEWLILLGVHRSFKKAYRKVSFEQEAYTYQYDRSYLKRRKSFSWVQFSTHIGGVIAFGFLVFMLGLSIPLFWIFT